MVLEKSIENAVNRWAIAHGILHRKMNGMGNRDWPDQLFYSSRFNEGTKGVFIEFKRPGNVPTDKQRLKHMELRMAGFDVAWFDNKKEAVEFLTAYLRVQPVVAKKGKKDAHTTKR